MTSFVAAHREVSFNVARFFSLLINYITQANSTSSLILINSYFVLYSFYLWLPFRVTRVELLYTLLATMKGTR